MKGHTWCGPYALALVMGMTYEEALDRVKRSTRRKRIKGMWNTEVAKVLRGFGLRKCKFSYIPEKERTNLANMTDWFKPNRIYIVNVTDHYVVLNTKDWTMTDNCTEGWVPINIEHKNGRRQTVAYCEAYRIPD